MFQHSSMSILVGAHFWALLVAVTACKRGPESEDLSPPTPRTSLPSQPACVVSGSQVYCDYENQIIKLELDSNIDSATGTASGGACATNTQGRIHLWSNITGPVQSKSLVTSADDTVTHDTVALMPDGQGCCAFWGQSMTCLGGEFAGKEELAQGRMRRYGGWRAPVKISTGFILADPLTLMSREEWHEISYLRSVEGIQSVGGWYDMVPLESVFLRNAWLEACSHAPPKDRLCMDTAGMFASIGAAPISELVFGTQGACVLRKDGALSCVGPQGICTSGEVLDVDIGTWSTCIATVTGVSCWRNEAKAPEATCSPHKASDG
jgi:hypothetical protein